MWRKTWLENFAIKRFENAGALSTHVECKRSVVISQPGEQSYSSGVNVTDGEEGPSMETSLSKNSGKRNAGDKKKQISSLKEEAPFISC